MKSERFLFAGHGQSALPGLRASLYSEAMQSIVRALIVLSLCGTLVGCSSLIVRDEDSGALVAGKIVARALAAIPTVGISEGILVDLKDAERNRAWRRQQLPQSAEACRREWQGYVEDRALKHIPDQVISAVFAATGYDYMGSAVRALNMAGVVPDADGLQAEWQRTLAREPQAAPFPPRPVVFRSLTSRQNPVSALDPSDPARTSPNEPKRAQTRLTRLRRLCITEAPIVNVYIGA
jgi:hypothetical protein